VARLVGVGSALVGVGSGTVGVATRTVGVAAGGVAVGARAVAVATTLVGVAARLVVGVAGIGELTAVAAGEEGGEVAALVGAAVGGGFGVAVEGGVTVAGGWVASRTIGTRVGVSRGIVGMVVDGGTPTIPMSTGVRVGKSTAGVPGPGVTRAAAAELPCAERRRPPATTVAIPRQ